MQSLKKLCDDLKQSQSLKQLVNLLQSFEPSIDKFTPLQFSESQHHQRIITTIQKLKFTQVENSFKNLPTIPQITAIIIKSTQKYTLAFLMIPQKRYFGWHDHAKMNGISTLISGELIIRALNPQHLQKVDEQSMKEVYSYPVDRIRQERLTNSRQRISIIYPDSFNIHQIYGAKQSCFLDLLMPEYPDNNCSYFQTCNEPIIQTEYEDRIKIQRLHKSYDQIIGIESLVKIFRDREKVKHKNIILQMPNNQTATKVNQKNKVIIPICQKLNLNINNNNVNKSNQNLNQNPNIKNNLIIENKNNKI